MADNRAGYEAALNGDAATLKKLLHSPGGDVYISSPVGNILYAAAKGGHLACVRYVAEQYPFLASLSNTYNEETPLLVACRLKHDLEVIEILCKIDEGLNVIPSTVRMTPLVAAVKTTKLPEPHLNHKNNSDNEYKLKVAEMLIQHGADVNVHELDVMNACIFHAVRESNVEILRLLLNHEARIDLIFQCEVENEEEDLVECYFTNILTIACLGKEHPCQVIQMLIQKDNTLINSETDETENYIAPTLVILTQNNCIKCIDFMIKKNIQFTTYGESCIRLAAVYGFQALFIKLFEHCRDPDTNKLFIESSLNAACSFGQLEMVNYLLSHDSINYHEIQPDGREQPLFAALQGMNPDVLKAVLNHPLFCTHSSIFYITEGYFAGMNAYIISYFLHCRHYAGWMTDYSQVEMMIKILIEHNFSINSIDGSLPALTALMKTWYVAQNDDDIMSLMHMLLENGANVYDMSLVRNETSIFHTENPYVVGLMIEFEIPDVLHTAYSTFKQTAVQHLLTYWPHEPILLLLLDQNMVFMLLLKWLRILVVYGWQSPAVLTRVVNFLQNKIDESEDEDDPDQNEVKVILEKMVQRPVCSLKCLARFATRKMLYSKMAEYNKTLPEMIKSLYIVTPITAFLMMEDN